MRKVQFTDIPIHKPVLYSTFTSVVGVSTCVCEFIYRCALFKQSLSGTTGSTKATSIAKCATIRVASIARQQQYIPNQNNMTMPMPHAPRPQRGGLSFTMTRYDIEREITFHVCCLYKNNAFRKSPTNHIFMYL